MSQLHDLISRSELIGSLRKCGLIKGDTVFVHASLLALGLAGTGQSANAACELVLSALRDTVGTEGTLFLPAYSQSFVRNEVFDPMTSPAMPESANCSPGLMEQFRHQTGALRSADPNYSVVGLGPKANAFLFNLPQSSFGPDCLFDRLAKQGGKVCTIGIGIGDATLRHHIEEIAGVPFRFKKLFTGHVQANGALRKQGWITSIPIQAENGWPDGSRLTGILLADASCKTAKISQCEIAVMSCRDFAEVTSREINRDPWFTAKGPAGDALELEAAYAGRRDFQIELPTNASMHELIDGIWTLPRDIVSDGYDVALQALARQVPMTIHEFPSGTESWSWVVPEKWTCHEAYLETIDGQRLFSYADQPLHVVSYSLPFEGEISREELFKHLHVHPRLADAIPFIFKYYERDWGLCCSQKQKNSFHDDRYRVVIRSSFTYGSLKVGQVVAPGRSDDTIILCAHLCHPHQVNDDLTGVVVGIEVMRALLQRRDLRYTYCFLIVPETIGSVAWLSQHENLIPRMKGGLFLEMLGRNHPHALQLSHSGDTEIDQCFATVLRESDASAWTGKFRTVVGNDERQFNGPGVRVPMLSLSRVLPPSSGTLYFTEYHSSHDTPNRVPSGSLEKSRDLVLQMLDTFEKNVVPRNQFKGEVFCSRFGVHIDAYEDAKGNRALFDIMDLADGKNSVQAIAARCGIPFSSAWNALQKLHGHGLVTWDEAPREKRELAAQELGTVFKG
jgi:aminopeptidase-like protein/aminoglycoside N3'-acetyltransferase